MRWTRPAKGEVRWCWHFAWRPVRVETVVAWLEWYQIEEVYTDGWEPKEHVTDHMVTQVYYRFGVDCNKPPTDKQEAGKLTLVK